MTMIIGNGTQLQKYKKKEPNCNHVKQTLKAYRTIMPLTTYLDLEI